MRRPARKGGSRGRSPARRCGRPWGRRGAPVGSRGGFPDWRLLAGAAASRERPSGAGAGPSWERTESTPPDLPSDDFVSHLVPHHKSLSSETSSGGSCCLQLSPDRFSILESSPSRTPQDTWKPEGDTPAPSRQNVVVKLSPLKPDAPEPASHDRAGRWDGSRRTSSRSLRAHRVPSAGRALYTLPRSSSRPHASPLRGQGRRRSQGLSQSRTLTDAALLGAEQRPGYPETVPGRDVPPFLRQQGQRGTLASFSRATQTPTLKHTIVIWSKLETLQKQHEPP